MSRFYHDLMRYINGLDTHEWMLALLVAIVIGVISLRGFGSRSSY